MPPVLCNATILQAGKALSSPPSNIATPVVSGTAYPQETLTCSTGTWAGTPAPTFSYQWYDADTLADISGATSSTYVIQLTDIGRTLKCRVVATNSAGEAAAPTLNSAFVWHPNQIAGVARFWWSRANVLNSISPDVAATDGQTVRRWNGILTGTQANQTTGASQPIYRATGQSGGPSLEFDGSNDSLALPVASNVLQNKSQAYLVVGARDTNNTAGTGAHPLAAYSVGGSASIRLAIMSRFNTLNNFAAVARRQDADASASAVAANNSSYNVLAAHGDYSNGFVRLRVNGSVSASTALASGSGSTSNTASVAANIGTNALDYFPGHITAVCVVNAAITATELSQLERFIGLMGGLDIPLV